MEKRFNRVKGLAGEKKAVEYLKKSKYKILETNFTCKQGEIDIIALKNDYIVFVEVKARETLEYGNPSEAVNTLKQNKIRSSAEIYLIKNKKMENPCLFDVIEIHGEKINHIENAF